MFQFGKPIQRDPLQRYCEKKRCESLVQYNKIGTGGNDPSISANMRYAQLVKIGKFTKVTKKQIKTICPGVPTEGDKHICTNPQFSVLSVRPTDGKQVYFS